jgi:hypothetical protein
MFSAVLVVTFSGGINSWQLIYLIPVITTYLSPHTTTINCKKYPQQTNIGKFHDNDARKDLIFSYVGIVGQITLTRGKRPPSKLNVKYVAAIQKSTFICICVAS